MLPCSGADPFHFGERKDHPAGTIVGVLDLHERRRGVDDVASRLAGCNEVFGCKQAAVADLRELDARVRRRSTGLMPHRVTLATDNDIVARPCVQLQRKLVGHVAGRHKQARLFAKHPRHQLLQPIHARVLPELIVTHRRLGHYTAHLGRRPGHRVGSQVDHHRRRSLLGPGCEHTWAKVVAGRFDG